MSIDEICREAIAARTFPGCQIGVLRGDEISVSGHGRLTYDAGAAAVTDETLYDVASVTKSIPTNSLILALIEQGKLGLDDGAVEYLPELRNQYRDQILIRHLLTYTVILDLPTGLADVARDEPSRLLHTVFSTPLKAPPGEQFYYTNTPALMLGLIAEKICGKPLDKVAEEMFFAPLEMKRTSFKPRRDINSIAPSELTEDGPVIGEPHDGSARVLRRMGMVAGHAGLFSTAGDLLKFVRMLIHDGSWEGRGFFTPETVMAMHTNQLERLGNQVGLGWEMSRALVADGIGSPTLFGKTGFTGCSIVADPELQTAFVILSNRTYPRSPETREGIVAVRHDLARLLLKRK
jgi:CubicO group peptidase (beta-lactamase class C family)